MSGTPSTSEKPPVAAIVQARMGSTRLPGKSLKPLAGRPMLAHVLERSRAIEGVDTVVLATGRGKENLPLIDLARSLGCEAFAGSETDVLDRFYRTAQKYPCRYIVRVTGDNPFTDPAFAAETLRLAIAEKGDNTALTGLPLGCAVEVISFDALAAAHRRGREAHHREHVSPYIKERPEEFTIIRRAADFTSPLENLRLTIDTEVDFLLAEKIFNALYNGSLFSLGEVNAFLEKNPSLVQINAGIEQRPMTHSGGA